MFPKLGCSLIYIYLTGKALCASIPLEGAFSPIHKTAATKEVDFLSWPLASRGSPGRCFYCGYGLKLHV